MQNQDIPDNPIHKWKMPELKDLHEYMPLDLGVLEFMDTELYTVHQDDSIELVAELMDYNNIRYTPVENEKGALIGLVSSRIILKNLVKKSLHPEKKEICVKEVMIKNPISIEPSKSITEAIEMMTEHDLGCLPVVQENELVGTITEKVFVQITSKLIDAMK
jgi:CBS domain-containing protein